MTNLMGLVAMAWLLVLLATSSDRAVRRLGPGVWTWLQNVAHVVFYLGVLHAAYFLYMHYTLSFHRGVPPEPNWFRVPLLMLAGAVIALQIASPIQGVRHRRVRLTRRAPTTSSTASIRMSRRPARPGQRRPVADARVEVLVVHEILHRRGEDRQLADEDGGWRSADHP